jgi:outer membrane protein assembly factor BamB
MRVTTMLLCLLALGCGEQPAARSPEKSARADPPQDPPRAAGRAGSDWPTFQGPTGDGVSSETGILHPWPKKGLRIVWHRPTGSGYGAPVVSKGRLFLFDRDGSRARLRCLDSHTGHFFWKFEYPTDYSDSFGYNNGPRCCPVVDGDRVYLFGAEGMLHCLRTRDGKPIWKVDTRAEFRVVQNFFGVASVPVVEGDLLLVQVGGSPKGSDREDFLELKGDRSGVVAFDKFTGKVRYRISDELASYASPVLATIERRRWCFVFARGGLLGFEPASGKVDFHFPWRSPDLESVNASNPVVVGDRVFLSETYGPGSALLRVRPGGYRVLWTDAGKRGRKKSMQCHWSTPIYHAGYLYGCSGRHPHNAELRCVELATGKVMWSRPGLARTSLLLVDSHFVCLSEEGPLRLLKVNPHRYEEVSVWEVREGENEPLLQYPCWAAPVLAHGLLYVRSADHLVCLELIPPRK